MDVKVSKNTVTILNSYQYSKNDFDKCLDYIEDNYTSDVFLYRTRKSLKREWAVHNLCYRYGLWRSHTVRVDFEVPITKRLERTYKVLGIVAMLMIE